MGQKRLHICELGSVQSSPPTSRSIQHTLPDSMALSCSPICLTPKPLHARPFSLFLPAFPTPAPIKHHDPVCLRQGRGHYVWLTFSSLLGGAHPVLLRGSFWLSSGMTLDCVQGFRDLNQLDTAICKANASPPVLAFQPKWLTLLLLF